MIDAFACLDKVLERYERTFDLTRPFSLEGERFDAYGYFSSRSEKYVLTRKANLWTACSFEHVLFRVVDELTSDEVEAAKARIEGPMQSVLVTKGKKYPEKDHMCSYLTEVFLCRQVAQAAREALQVYRYDRSYLFNFLGYCEGRLVAVDLAHEAVYTSRSRSAKKLMPLYLDLFRRG